MAINSNVRNNQNILEYGKFVELVNDSNFPPLTTTRTGTRDNGSTYSSTQVYPKYAVLSHLTNPEDIKISLSAEQINVNVADIENLLGSTNSVLSAISSFNLSLNTKIPILSTIGNRLVVDNTNLTQTVAGTVTVIQPTAANLHARVHNPTAGNLHAEVYQPTAGNLNATVVGTGTFTAVQGTATNLKTQAESYQGGNPVGSGNPLQVSLANTGANTSLVNVSGSGIFIVSDRGSIGETTVTSFSATTSDTLKNANNDRKLLTIYNEGAGNLHILYGSGTASTTNYSVKLFSGDYLEIDKYTGQVNATFSAAGTARVTEIT